MKHLLVLLTVLASFTLSCNNSPGRGSSTDTVTIQVYRVPQDSSASLYLYVAYSPRTGTYYTTQSRTPLTSVAGITWSSSTSEPVDIAEEGTEQLPDITVPKSDLPTTVQLAF